jgi:succinate dehydrogenase / fumarate reductase, cytochrome b subunit
MKQDKKRYDSHLGLWGWLGGGRWQIERYAYTLHRISGLAILAYFLMHIFVTGSRLGGQQKWSSTMSFFENPLFEIGEFLLFLAFAYHAMNGIRLVITELGLMLGKPSRPIYPYSNSTMRQRPLLVVIMILAGIIMVAGGANTFLLE